MGQISITVNARTFRLQCEDGDEARAEAMARHITAKVDALVARHGQIGDERLLLMAAMMTADELFEAREALETARSDAGNATAPSLVE